MPRGGWLREVRRWACCGLRRTGEPSPELWGVHPVTETGPKTIPTGSMR